jgi:ATPases involved in chromosome partitioning
MTSILSVVNQKGGVGKSTTVVNLGAALSQKGYKTLVIDCDPQGNATTGLGIQKAAIKYGSYNMLLGPMPDKKIIPKSIENLFVLGAGEELIGAEVELTNQKNREYRLRDSIAAISGEFDYILIDCPPSLGFLTINAMTASNGLIVPLQCEYYALEGLSQLLKTMKAIKKSLNPSLNEWRILLTMYDKRNNLSKQVVEEVHTHFSSLIFEVVIPRNVRLSEAPSYGKPISLYAPQSIGAKAYDALASELVQIF